MSHSIFQTASPDPVATVACAADHELEGQPAMLLRCRQELIICFVSKPRLGQDEQPRPGKGQGLVHSDLVKRSPLDDGSPGACEGFSFADQSTTRRGNRVISTDPPRQHTDQVSNMKAQLFGRVEMGPQPFVG